MEFESHQAKQWDNLFHDLQQIERAEYTEIQQSGSGDQRISVDRYNAQSWRKHAILTTSDCVTSN
jgi:hypothetical protein